MKGRLRKALGRLRKKKIESATYDVGYGKPPKANQFKPGHCPNPKGRPKGAKNKVHTDDLAQIILEESKRLVTVNEGGQSLSIPISRTIARAIAVGAAKGGHHQQQLFVEMTLAAEEKRDAVEAKDAAADDMWNEFWMHYKFEMERRQKDCLERGVSWKEPIPHPKQVHIDVKAGKVEVLGPFTDEEKGLIDGELQKRWNIFIAPQDHAIADVEKRLAGEKRPAIRRRLERELAAMKETLCQSLLHHENIRLECLGWKKPTADETQGLAA